MIDYLSGNEFFTRSLGASRIEKTRETLNLARENIYQSVYSSKLRGTCLCAAASLLTDLACASHRRLTRCKTSFGQQR